MKKIALALVFAMLLVPAVFAQDKGEMNHATVGVFAHYLRLSAARSANLYGVGGRIGFNVHPNVQFEAEMGYDFERNVTTTIPAVTGLTTTFVRSPLRVIDGLFGPKFQVGTGAFRAFATAKGGFINFSNNRSFSGQVGNIASGDTNGVFYPGGGIEAYAGPVGIRIEAGDEIYWANGAHNNLRITAGPQFRF